MIQVAIIGLGARGSKVFADYCFEKADNVKITSICDIDRVKVDYYAKKYNIPKDQCFYDEESFLKEKRGDILFICTMDKNHYPEAIAGLKLGYDIMLEKPIATTAKECIEICELSRKLKKHVWVAHVLRYTMFYRTIKSLIDDGKIGDIIHVQQAENVAYWHQAHSFVRGNWRNSDETSPMILQKCCHDLDIINWLIGNECQIVSSFGSLKYFTKENMPEGAPPRCTDGCPYADTCLYETVKDYVGKRWWKQYSTIDGGTDEDIMRFLRESKYGRCVYQCDNNVVDHQVVNMQFEQGITASLTMCAFSKECYRETKVMGTKGEIIADDKNNLVKLCIYEGEDIVYDINKMATDLSGHGGGDNEFLSMIFKNYNQNDATLVTDVGQSLRSHLMALAAEESRITGQTVSIDDFLKKNS